MTVKLSSLRADIRAQDEGEWIDIPTLPGVRLRTRSLTSPGYRLKRDQWAQRMARTKMKGREADAELGRILASEILLGWEGFDVPYSPDVALAELADPAGVELRNHVLYAAEQVGQAQVEFLEEAVGNSAPASAGN